MLVLAQKSPLSLQTTRVSQHLTGRIRVSSGCSQNNFGQCLQYWSYTAKKMLEQCEQLGVGTRCPPVYYERLVLDTESTVRRVLRFLGLPWTDAVLRHQDFFAPANLSDASHDHQIILNKCVLHTALTSNEECFSTVCSNGRIFYIT